MNGRDYTIIPLIVNISPDAKKSPNAVGDFSVLF